MRVVHIQPGGFYDGLTYQENLLTKWQRKNGHDVTVITTRWSADADGGSCFVPESMYDYVNDDGVRLIRLPLTCADRYTFGYDELYRTIEALSPEILFMHGIGFNTAVIADYLTKHKEVKAYADNHANFSNAGSSFPRIIQHLTKLFLKTGLPAMFTARQSRKWIPCVKKFYGVMPSRVEFLKNIFGIPAEKCELLLMGADDDLVSEASDPSVRQNIRSQYGISPEDFLVMTGGKIDIPKSQTLLLMEAVRDLDAERGNVRLIVFGAIVPELKARFDALVDGKTVQHVGYVKGNDSYKYFAASDLVVFPGRNSVYWEQVTGLGIPMLCKEWDGTKHVDLGGNVRFLRHDSTREIRREIERLLDNPGEYERMKEVAQREGMKVFSYRRIARQSLEEV